MKIYIKLFRGRNEYKKRLLKKSLIYKYIIIAENIGFKVRGVVYDRSLCTIDSIENVPHYLKSSMRNFTKK